VQRKFLDPTVWKNIQALLEIRDSAIHFYNPGASFLIRLQEIGSASSTNFVAVVRDWFGRGLDEFNFYLMPLSFMTAPKSVDAVMLHPEEKKFISYLNLLEEENSTDTQFSVALKVQVNFIRSKAKDATTVRVDNSDPEATRIQLTEEDIRQRYPYLLAATWYAAIAMSCGESIENHGPENAVGHESPTFHQPEP